MGGSAEDQVRRWSESSGAALELRVAAAFRKRLGDRAVDHGSYYPAESSSTGMREVDVVAKAWMARHLTDGVPDVAVTAVIECKAYKKSPWVLFESDERLVRKGHEFLERLPRARSDSRLEMHAVDTIGARLLGPIDEPYAYQVATAAEQRDDDRNIAWDAVRQVLDAADVVQWREKPPGKPQLSIYLPIIVVSAPLFAMKVSGSGELISRSVGRMPLLAATSVSPKPVIRGPGPRRAELVRDVFKVGVWVVNEGHLEELADAVVSAAQEVRLTSLP